MVENHSHEQIVYSNDAVEISAYLYRYPWHLNQCFVYLPKGPVWIQKKKSSNAEMLKALREFWYQVITAARERGCTYLKADFDEVVLQHVGVTSDEALYELLETLQSPDGKKNFPKIELRRDTKTIQYMQTMVLNGKNLKSTKQAEYTPEALQDFYTQNPEFWANTNQNVRRYTRKALKGEWHISVNGGPERFEDFWRVYQATAKRQQFATHGKDYFERLFQEDWSHVITLARGGEVQCVWFGVESEDTLTYLYGGNTEAALKSKAQYLMHVAALQLLCERGLSYYDLGGYDPEKGFGKFKEGYRGEIRTFLGPVDVVLESRKYDFTNKFVGAAKSLTSWIR